MSRNIDENAKANEDQLKHLGLGLASSIVVQLSRFDQIIPAGPLTKLLHASHSVGFGVLDPTDEGERRNLRWFRCLEEEVSKAGEKYEAAVFSSSFKPKNFIHPFRDYYSLPGFLDGKVLNFFFDAVDVYAKKIEETPIANTQKGERSREGAGFLAFVYVFFLLVH